MQDNHRTNVLIVNNDREELILRKPEVNKSFRLFFVPNFNITFFIAFDFSQRLKERVMLLVTKKFAQAAYLKFEYKKQIFWNTNSS